MSLLSQEIAKGVQGGLPWAETEMITVGDTVAGTVIDAEFRQAFNPETKQPAVWEKSGEPVMEVVVKVSGTGKFRADLEDDNGDRAFHIRWAFENKAAFIEAMNVAGVEEPMPGGKFAGQLVTLRPNGGVRKPTKLFRYEYQAPPSGLAQAVADPGAPLLGGPTPPAADPWAAATKAAPAAPPVTAPAPTAAPTSFTTADDPMAVLNTVKALIAFGMTDEQIMGATKADAKAIAAIRAL